MGTIRDGRLESSRFKARHSPGPVSCDGVPTFLNYLYELLKFPQDLSSRNAADRPFKPPIHVLILPSKLPLDLRLHFRDVDEEHVVCCSMNLYFF
jgi:hypothetical protein